MRHSVAAAAKVVTEQSVEPIEARQCQDCDAPGDMVCQSGHTSSVKCGAITDVDHEMPSYQSKTWDRMRTASYESAGGHSGAPVFVQETRLAAGIHSGHYGGGDSIYSHVYEIKLDFSFLSVYIGD